MEQISQGKPGWLVQLVHHRSFTKVVMILILLNALLVGLETYPVLYEPYSGLFHVADRILLWLFTIEIVLRLWAADKISSFLKDNWNIFDLIVILSGHFFVGAQFITVLRILRILRVLRAVSVIPSLRKMVNALLLTIPAMGNIGLLLSIFFYIYSVIGTFLFADAAPEYFGTLHASLLTLFQVVTLESWASGVMRPILAIVPWSWLYFVTFILLGTFVIFNLFVGVIVTNIDKANEEDAPPSEVKELEKQIAELKEVLLQIREDQIAQKRQGSD
ncbi:ion transporter [Ammoniphilus sp. YIM 78166]|uniref:ion transporter n=1 Tax=Ammoniphilus sp. YIM 78166 TaxID=1644106 RepID=UPI00106F52ED|nr:ion transporter [Ammoniphilus sp. YIM 78166]